MDGEASREQKHIAFDVSIKHLANEVAKLGFLVDKVRGTESPTAKSEAPDPPADALAVFLANGEQRIRDLTALLKEYRESLRELLF